MERLSFIIFLLLWTSNLARRRAPHTDVTYEELEELDAVCDYQDNCKIKRSADTLLKYTCHCESFCSELGTCCIDSPYRGKPSTGPVQTCKTAYGRDAANYFMVDSCRFGGNADGVWEKLCESEDDHDLMPLVPVTSLSTNVTYKNYFCFRCHEAEIAYRYWNVKLFSNLKINEDIPENTLVTYDSVKRTWTAPIGKEAAPVPVTLGVEIPADISDLPKLCALNVISSCSAKWRDVTMRRKCNAYTSIIYIPKNDQYLSYRNPHCALCNFENLEKMLCSFNSVVRITSKKPFSFSHLLDINRSDGDKVGKIRQCDANSIWDPFFNKCRILKCALPGHEVRDGKCTPS